AQRIPQTEKTRNTRKKIEDRGSRIEDRRSKIAPSRLSRSSIFDPQSSTLDPRSSYACSAFSEFYLQSELDVPRSERASRSAEGGAKPVAHGPVQVHSVEEVVEFRSEDEVCAFLAEEPGDLSLLREDEICFGGARTREGVATQVPDLPERW